VQRALANIQSGSFLTDNVLLVVPAVTQADASAQVSITDATPPPNQLPPDLLVPVKLWERANGSSDDFTEMTDLTDHNGLPSAPRPDAAILGVARRRIVFPGRDAGHANPPALSEVVSDLNRFGKSSWLDSPGVRSSCLQAAASGSAPGHRRGSVGKTLRPATQDDFAESVRSGYDF